MRYLTHEVYKKLIDNISNNYKDVLDFLVFSGMRLGNVLDLRWEDIDFKNRIIIVRAQKSKNKEDLIIPINEKLCSILQKRKSKKQKETDRIFKHSASEFRRAFKKALKGAGLDEKIRIHDLRHTYASWLAQMGAELIHIKTLLGHKEIRTTMRYAHLGIQSIRRVSDSLVQFIQGQSVQSRNRD